MENSLHAIQKNIFLKKVFRNQNIRRGFTIIKSINTVPTKILHLLGKNFT